MRILLWIIVTVYILVLPHLVNLHSTPVWLRYIHILAVGKWCSVLCVCVYWCSSEVSRVHEITLHATEVEDTHRRMAFLEGGAIMNLPLFYLEGISLFIHLKDYAIDFQFQYLPGWLLDFI